MLPSVLLFTTNCSLPLLSPTASPTGPFDEPTVDFAVVHLSLVISYVNLALLFSSPASVNKHKPPSSPELTPLLVLVFVPSSTAFNSISLSSATTLNLVNERRGGESSVKTDGNDVRNIYD